MAKRIITECACVTCKYPVEKSDYTYPLCEMCDGQGCKPEKTTHDATPRPAAHEQAVIEALDPALTPLCVSFVGMQETPTRAFGLYNVEEDIDSNLILHSTVSLQTIAAYGYRPVMV